MSVRVRWQFPGGEGVATLRGAPLHLLWTRDGFDAASRPPAGADGLTLDPPDAEHKVQVEAHGGLELQGAGKAFRRARLPAGKGVSFVVGGIQGRLLLEGGEDPLAGREIGGYRILARLGAGAVGVVYRALQINLQREVALKVLAPALSKDPAKVESFRREARAAGKLVHPNVVQVYDVGEDQGRHFYSMELLPRGSLEDRIREDGPLPWQKALESVRDCAAALAFAEERRLVHRDVKPDNLMVAESGTVKLADLGLAATRGMIQGEAAGGTPHFMAPEAVAKAPLDHRADLYSLGCTFFRLVTGGTPFQGGTVRDILRAHRDQAPPTFRAAGVPAPRRAEALLAWLLQKNPDKRPANASQVVEAATAALHSGPSRLRMAMLLAALLGAGGWAAWQTFGPQAAPAQGREVVRFMPDPELEAQVRQQGIDLALARAQALADPRARAEALEAFAARYPGSVQAAEARRSAAALRRAEAEQPPAVEAPPLQTALAAMTERVEADLAGGRFAAALDHIARGKDLDAFDRNALRARVFRAAGERFAGWSAEHAAALEARDWAAAASLRERIRSAVAEPPAAGSGWLESLAELEEAARRAEHEGTLRAFRAARLVFLELLHGPVETNLLRLDPEAALAAYRQAVTGCAHPGLQAAAAAVLPHLEAAVRARRGLEQRLASGAEPALQEAAEGKRAVLRALGPGGLDLLVQVRGVRTERHDPLEPYLDPVPLEGLLAAGGGAAADRDSLALLVLHARVAGTVRGWAGVLPRPAEAAALAAAVRAGLEHAPAAPAELAAPLREFAAVCTALADEDDYLALLRLESFGERWSLLNAWLSDGEGSWGLKP